MEDLPEKIRQAARHARGHRKEGRSRPGWDRLPSSHHRAHDAERGKDPVRDTEVTGNFMLRR